MHGSAGLQWGCDAAVGRTGLRRNLPLLITQLSLTLSVYGDTLKLQDQATQTLRKPDSYRRGKKDNSKHLPGSGRNSC